MQRHYMEEDKNANTVVIYDDTGQAVAFFEGDKAVALALHWAEREQLDLYSTRNPHELFDHQKLFLRRRLRVTRGRRSPLTTPPRQPQDAPNVQRIIMHTDTDFENLFEDEEDETLGFSDDPWIEEIELAPLESSDEE